MAIEEPILQVSVAIWDFRPVISFRSAANSDGVTFVVFTVICGTLGAGG